LFIDFIISEIIKSDIFNDLFSDIFILFSFRKKIKIFDIYINNNVLSVFNNDLSFNV
jgi:hypothetical protein